METELKYLNDINTICNQIIQGYDVYHNACVVVNYYNKYGYTEHFRELIGEESLVDKAKEAISKFISWLKEKINQLIAAVKKFFGAIRHKVCKVLGIKETPKTSNSDFVKKSMSDLFLLMSQARDGVILIPYKYMDEVAEVFTDAHVFMRTRCKSTPFDAFKRKLDSYVDKAHQLCEKQKGVVGYRRGDVRDLARSIASDLGHIALLSDTLVFALEEFKLTISDDMTKEEFKEAILGISKQANDIFRDDIMDVGIQDGVKQVILIVTTISRASTELCSIGVSYLLDIDRLFNRDIPVEVTVKIPSHILKKMEHLFGGSVTVRNVIITNRRPMTWGLSDDTAEERPPYGWCYAKNNMSGSVDIYVNYRLYSNMWGPSGNATKDQIDSFMGTIVHECYHLFLAQWDKAPNNQKKEEDLVEKIEQKYYREYLNEEDRRWVRDVIKQIKSEL